MRSKAESANGDAFLVAVVDVHDGNIFGIEPSLADQVSNAQKDVLRVRLGNDLVPSPDGLNEEFAEARLESRVQVKFGLLNADDTFRRAEALITIGSTWLTP